MTSVEKPDVRALSRESLDALLSKKQESAESKVSNGEIGRTHSDSFPMSPYQAPIWLYQKSNLRSALYNIPIMLTFSNKPCLDTLQNAFNTVLKRHISLSSVFNVEGDVVYQRRINKSIIIRKYDIEQAPDKEILLNDIIFSEKNYDFNFSYEPLIRVSWVNFSESKNHLLILTHHLVFDGSSVNVFLKDLSDAYNSISCSSYKEKKNTKTLDKPEYTEKDFSDSLSFWKKKLKGANYTACFPVDYTRQKKTHRPGKKALISFSGEINLNIENAAKSIEATSFSVYLSAFFILLQRYSQEKNIVVGTPYANRNRMGSRNIIGMMTNTIAIRATVDPNITLHEFVKTINNTSFESIEHGEIPFGEVVRHVNPEREIGYNPIFQNMFSFQNMDLNTPPLGEHKYKIDLIDNGCSKFDTTFQVMKKNNNWEIEIEYNTDLFEEITILSMGEHYKKILSEIPRSLEDPVCHLNIASDPAPPLAKKPNEGNAPLLSGKTLVELLENSFSRYKKNISLKYKNIELTYEELDKKTKVFSYYLHENITESRTIGVCIERSIDMIVSIISILRAGFSYLPIDIEWPKNRIQHCLNNSSVTHLIISNTSDTQKTNNLDVSLIDISNSCQESQSHTNLSAIPYPSPNSLAYIIYTSGTTGAPKGVGINHQAISHHIQWRKETLKYTEEDVFLQKTPYTFDVSIWEILTPLVSGSKIIIAEHKKHADPYYLGEIIFNEGISVAHFVPSMLDIFIQTKPNLSSMKHIITSGESLPNSLAKHVISNYNIDLYNFYGPTECTIDVTYHKCLKNDYKTPIGKPISGVEIHILDKLGRTCPIGVSGEICIQGLIVSRGYINNPTETKKYFSTYIHNGEKKKIYKTGDLGRWLHSGEIEYLGRIDDEVKIRGIRVNLSEVVDCIKKHPCINSVASLPYRDKTNHTNIACFYIVSEASSVDRNSLAQHMSKWLPTYMIPSYLCEISSFPTTHNGKLDKKLLLSKILNKDRTSPSQDKSNLSKSMISIWEGILNEKISLHDNFFSLGGHSLSALNLITKINDFFNVSLNLDQFLTNPTPSHMIELVNKNKKITNPYTKTKFPMTNIQQAYWVGSHKDIELSHFGAHFYAEISTFLIKENNLRSAIFTLINRHSMLRTIIQNNENIVLETNQAPPIRYIEMANLTENERAKKLISIRNELIYKTYDPGKYPLFDVHFSALSNSLGRLHISFNLLICDAQSIYIFLKELYLLVTNKSLPKISYSFGEYVLYTNRMKETLEYKKAKKYWKNRIPSLPLSPQLPTLRKKTILNSISRLSDKLNPDEWEKLKSIAKENNITPSSLLLTVFGETLAFWSDNNKFCINLTLFNRLPAHKDVNNIMGDFTELNLLEFESNPHEGIIKRSQNTQKQLWKDLLNRQYGGLKVLRDLSIYHGKLGEAIMPIVFTSTLTQEDGLDASVIKPLGDFIFGASQTPQVTLDHQVYEYQGGLSYHWDTLEGVFDSEMIHEIFSTYSENLKGIAREEISLDENLSLLQKKHIEVYNKVNSTDYLFDEKTLHEGFFVKAGEKPNNTALIYRDLCISYNELHQHINWISHKIRKYSIEKSTPVAIVMEKGWKQIASAFAILRAGLIYIPVDSKSPEERIKKIIRQSGCCYAIIDETLTHYLNELNDIKTIILPGDFHTERFDDIEHETKPEDIAYIIFTSGSTGDPKGVTITHSAAMNTIQDINHRFSITKKDSVFSISAFHFDLSVYDIFGLLSVGGKVFVCPDDKSHDPSYWNNSIIENEITVWNSVPALFDIFIDYIISKNLDFPLSIRIILLSGDWVPIELAKKAKSLTKNVQLIALGGATEASIWSNFFEINKFKKTWKSIPYGYPLSNQRYYVLDKSMRQRPFFSKGDLYIAGKGLAKGYWKNTKKTDEQFIYCPTLNDRLYKTGDLARYWPDGTIEFLGREDNQVKIRGYRIELGEIEHVLSSCESIDRSIVINQKNESDRNLLVAYIKQKDGFNISEEELLNYCKSHLPEYMVPQKYLSVNSWPLTGNGKIDINKLKKMKKNIVLEKPQKDDKKIGSNKLKEITRIIESITHIENLSPNQNMLEIGITSIEIVLIINSLDKHLGIRMTLNEFYRNPTPLEMNKYFHSKQKTETHHIITSPEERKTFKNKRVWYRKDLEGMISPIEKNSFIDTLLSPLKASESSNYISFGDNNAIQTYILIKSKEYGELFGLHYYDPINHALSLISNDISFFNNAYTPIIYRPGFEESEIAIYFISDYSAIKPLYGEESCRFCSLQAGSMSQCLAKKEELLDFKVTHVGVIDFDVIKNSFSLKEGQRIEHSIFLTKLYEIGEI